MPNKNNNNSDNPKPQKHGIQIFLFFFWNVRGLQNTPKCHGKSALINLGQQLKNVHSAELIFF